MKKQQVKQQQIIKSGKQNSLSAWKLGMVQFKVNPSKINAIVIKLGGKMNSKEWELNEQRYSDWDLQQQLIKQNILTLYLQKLRISIFSYKSGNSETSTILKQLSNIKFPHLKQLNLQGNKITSVQPLSLLKLQNIKQINLGSNLISCIKAFRKITFNYLQEIYLSKMKCNIQLEKNIISQIADQFSYVNTLMLRSVQLQTFRTDKCQGQNLSWITKINSPIFQWLYIVSPRVNKKYQFNKVHPLLRVKSLARRQ